MPVKIVDASALAALLFGEPEAEKVVEQLRGCTLFAPALLGFEMASICLKKCRRYPQRRATFLTALELLDRMEIRIVDVNYRAITELAAETGLTSYDAGYLWLARHLRGELVTLDQKLAAAYS